MAWQKEEECPIPKSEWSFPRLPPWNLDWLDCPKLTMSMDADYPQIDSDETSVPLFGTIHSTTNTALADENSIATAPASVANNTETADDDASCPPC